MEKSSCETILLAGLVVQLNVIGLFSLPDLPETGEFHELVVPHSMRTIVTKHSHDSLALGHLCIKRKNSIARFLLPVLVRVEERH